MQLASIPFFLLEPVATAKWWDAALHQTYGRKSIVKELIFPSSEFLSFAGCLRKWRTLNAHFSRCYVYFLEVVQEYYTLGTLGFMAIVWVAISINIRHEQSMTTTPKRPWNVRYFGNRSTTISWTSLTSIFEENDRKIKGEKSCAGELGNGTSGLFSKLPNFST